MDQAKREAEFAKYVKAYKDPKYEMRSWRRRRFKEYLRSISGRGFVSMLDVGCGRGQAMQIARQFGYIAVTGVEVVPELCQRDDVMLVEGAHDLPFEDGAFQLVVATDVMEHILENDVHDVLKEMFRVASHAIHLTISHRQDKPDNLGHKHVTLHSRQWWCDQIREAADESIIISVESDELTPPIKMPCTHLEVTYA